MNDFVHLHLHSEYSLLEGACRIDEISKAVNNAKQNAVAITDRSALFGVVDFYEKLKSEKINPIIGSEILFYDKSINPKGYSGIHPYKLVVLCKNYSGYLNLIKLTSYANNTKTANVPCVSLEHLKECANDLIIISDFYKGFIGNNYTFKETENISTCINSILGFISNQDLYFEVQKHKNQDDSDLFNTTLKYSELFNIEIVASNDVHYISSDDADAVEILHNISTGSFYSEDVAAVDDRYFKSSQEMFNLFKEHPQAIENTLKIAERCNVEIPLYKTQLPKFTLVGIEDNNQYFNQLCQIGLNERFGNNVPNEVINRLKYEISVIEQMDYVDYFLIVRDFILFAKTNHIMVGPGRGSGAGSLVAYCLNITDVNPIKYNLLFERFLNPERISMPDFDIDFCFVRRLEVVSYLHKKYGDNHSAQIITFGTLAPRAAIRDIAKAIGLSQEQLNAILKQIPLGPRVKLNDLLSDNSPLSLLIEQDKDIAKTINLAQKIEGLPRHASTHASGVVITQEGFENYFPVIRTDDSIIAQYSMNTLTKLGLLKFDILGLRTLTVIENTIIQIEGFELKCIDYSDSDVYKMLGEGFSEGVFQFESAGIKKLLMQIKPQQLEDLVSAVSLYRPGPMDFIPVFLQNRKDPNNIHYDIPELKPILDVTYGCIIYQEQVMQIFRDLAGYSYGHSDIVRRAMAKKDSFALEKEKDAFVNGAVSHGIERQKAVELFEKMRAFSNYAYNKAHAVSYAHISYQTAFLKYHYPKEYFASLMTSVFDDQQKLSLYISECKRRNINVCLPDINLAEKYFSVNCNSICFALIGIKNVGERLVDEILDIRVKKGKYQSIEDFCCKIAESKISLNKNSLESLVKAGSFDSFGIDRSTLINSVETLIEFISKKTSHNSKNQIGFFGQNDLAQTTSKLTLNEGYLPQSQLLLFEKDVTGVYLTSHPLQEYKNNRLSSISSFTQKPSNSDILCVVKTVKQKNTKTGKIMSFIEVEDETSLISVVVFPAEYEKYADLIFAGSIIAINLTVSQNNDRTEYICKSIYIPPKNSTPLHRQHSANNKYPGLHLLLDSKESELSKRAFSVLSFFNGDYSVYVKYNDTGKRFVLPQSMNVSDDSRLISSLKSLLGEDKVKFFS